jgi:hypothetical protein
MKISSTIIIILSFIAGITVATVNQSSKETETSPHAEAIRLVFDNQQKFIRELDKENWWHDVKKREWVVERPFAPGIMDSTHMFTVYYKIDGKEVEAWIVDTEKRTVDARSGRMNKNYKPEISELEKLFEEKDSNQKFEPTLKTPVDLGNINSSAAHF